MDINILNSSFEKIAIVDQYTSLMWCRRYAEIGALDIQVEVTPETLSVFRKGYYITRDDDWFEDANENRYLYIYRIEALEINTTEEGDNYLVVGAYECKQILKQRIVWSVINFTGTAENYIRKIITDNVTNPSDTSRRIGNFHLMTARGFTERIDQQTTYDNVCDKVMEVCKSYNFGWRIGFRDGGLYLDLYKGADHSAGTLNPVVFSPENENLISSKYSMDSSEFKNVALVGGEGEGDARFLATYGTATGLERFETFVDASSTSTDTDPAPTTSEYRAILANLGKEALAENSVVESFEGEVDTENMYQYKVHYELGDIVTLRNEYGISADARITEIIETWDSEGYTFEPKFEYMEVQEELEDYLLTESSIPLSTENGLMLISESSPSISTGSKRISELDPVDELYEGCCMPVVQNGETKKVTYSTLRSQLEEDIGVGRAWRGIIGDGYRKTYTVTHHLNTEEIVAQIWDKNGNELPSYELTRIDANNVQIDFASPIGENSVDVIIATVGVMEYELDSVDWDNVYNMKYMNQENMLDLLNS